LSPTLLLAMSREGRAFLFASFDSSFSKFNQSLY